MIAKLMGSAAVVLVTGALAPLPRAAAQIAEPAVLDDLVPLTRPAIDEADSLFFAMDPLAAMRRLEWRLEVFANDYESRWRAARAALVLGVMSEGEDRARWLRASVWHAELALAQRPGDTEAMSWVAATKGRLALTSVGTREKTKLGEQVWDLTAELLELDPEHPLGNDVRGKLHQEVARLSGFERFIGRIFLGGRDLMSQTSWEGAELHLELAIDADPAVVLFYLDLGETYMLQGKDEEARRVFEAGLLVPELYPPDAGFKDSIRRALERLEGRDQAPEIAPR